LVSNTPPQNHQEQRTQEADKPSKSSANVTTSIPSPGLDKHDNTEQSGQKKLVPEKDEPARYSSSARNVKSKDNTRAIERQDVDDQPKLDRPSTSSLDPVTHDRQIQAQQPNFEKEPLISKKQDSKAANKETDKNEGSSFHGHSDSEAAAPRKLDNAIPATPPFSGRAPNDPRERRKRNEPK
jgi:hypothetical protein